jgi:hypothetical protein
MSNIYTVTELNGFAHDIIADQPFVDQYYPGRWVLVGPEPELIVPLPLIITKVAMISRFTPQEYVGIISATKTDVEVQAWYDLFQAASRVDLEDQRTVAGINSLVVKNLLTQARATEILTAPVQPEERP